MEKNMKKNKYIWCPAVHQEKNQKFFKFKNLNDRQGKRDQKTHYIRGNKTAWEKVLIRKKQVETDSANLMK